MAIANTFPGLPDDADQIEALCGTGAFRPTKSSVAVNRRLVGLNPGVQHGADH